MLGGNDWQSIMEAKKHWEYLCINNLLRTYFTMTFRTRTTGFVKFPRKVKLKWVPISEPRFVGFIPIVKEIRKKGKTKSRLFRLREEELYASTAVTLTSMTSSSRFEISSWKKKNIGNCGITVKGETMNWGILSLFHVKSPIQDRNYRLKENVLMKNKCWLVKELFQLATIGSLYIFFFVKYD